MRTIALAAFLLLAACGSGSDGCDPGDSRCSGNAIQICNADENWETFRSCSAIGEQCTTLASRCGGFTGPCCD